MTLPIARDIAARAKSKGIGNYAFPEDIGAHGMLLMFREYTYSSSKQNMGDVSSRMIDTVVLPLPRALDDNYALRIERFEQGMLGDAISRAVEATNNGVGNGLMGAVDALQGHVNSIMPSGAEAKDLVNGVMGGEMPSAVLSRLSFLARNTLDKMGQGRNVDVALGSTVNPKAALYFDGVVMKQHTFDWDFMPRSKKESDTLRDILNLMRRHSLPTYIDVLGADGQSEILQRAMFKYPSIMEIKLLGLDERHYMTYKPCMIMGLNFNFAPQGHAILKGGKPAAVHVNMTVIETDIWTAESFGGSSSTEVE